MSRTLWRILLVFPVANLIDLGNEPLYQRSIYIGEDCPDPPADVSDTVALAPFISIGETIGGILETPGDGDVYRITSPPSQNGFYQIEVLGFEP